MLVQRFQVDCRPSYGSIAEKREHKRELVEAGRAHAAVVFDGALAMIAESGGGLVEAYPERTEGRDVSGVYVYLGTAAMFEQRGFLPQREVAKHHWVMTRKVEASPRAD